MTKAGSHPVVKARVRPDTFVDSVALMQATERVRALPGVRGAALAMATDLNRRLLADAGLLTAEAERAGPHDLVVVVSAESADAAAQAIGRAEELLAARRPDDSPHRSEPPRSITSAARALPGANVALVSVPGPHAVAEAHQALSARLHVFLFSDGVPLPDEVRLKRRAVARGRLVMGPECGTTIVNGVGLGSANRGQHLDLPGRSAAPHGRRRSGGPPGPKVARVRPRAAWRTTGDPDRGALHPLSRTGYGALDRAPRGRGDVVAARP